jgi:hypothetical protein
MTTHAHIKPYSGRVRYYVQSSTNVQMRAAGTGPTSPGAERRQMRDGRARVHLFLNVGSRRRSKCSQQF